MSDSPAHGHEVGEKRILTVGSNDVGLRRMPGPQQRILCLHGYGQSGSFFRQRIGSLRKALKAHVAEFSCPDAPFAATAAFLDGSGRDDALSWWQWEDSERPSTSLEYRGLEDTVARIHAICDAEGPFDGILGFSQGAALAGLLCLHPPWQPPRFRYAILVAGFVPRDPTFAAFESAAPSSMPSMHVYGQTDEKVPPPSSLRLSRGFVAPRLVSHPGGHAVPSDAAFRASLKDFVAEQAAAATAASPPQPPASRCTDLPNRSSAEREAERGDVEAEAQRAAEAYTRWRSIRGGGMV